MEPTTSPQFTIYYYLPILPFWVKYICLLQRCGKGPFGPDLGLLAGYFKWV